MEFRNISPKDDALVVRSNKLIEARYASTLHQQRIMLWLISEIRPEDRDFQTYRVTIKELAKFVGLETNKDIYRQLEEATRGMVGRVVEIGSFEEGELLQVGLISRAQYKYGDGFIDLSVDPALKPYLLESKANFTTAYLRDLLAMRSVYGIRMYDLLNQYRKIGKRTFKVEELKQMLGIERKYKEYKNFKARVVVPAVKEINERTDLLISYKERKAGRSVDALEFIIEAKDTLQAVKHEGVGEIPTDNELVDRLTSHGMKEAEALKFVRAYGETDPNRISGNIDKLEEGIREGKVKRPVPWLRKALNEDYRDQKSLFQKNVAEAEKEAEAIAAERRKREQAAERLQRRMEDQEHQYTEYRRSFVQSIIEDLSDDERAAWEKELVSSFTGIQRQFWKGEWDSRLTLTNVEDFIEGKSNSRCVDQEQWFAENSFPDLEGLRKEREALL